MEGGLSAKYEDRSKTPNILIDPTVKRDFSKDKIESASEEAEWFVSKTSVLATTKEKFQALIELVYGLKIDDSFSAGTGIFGKTKELSLLVSFSNGDIIYKLTALSSPDIGPRRGRE